MRIVDQNGRGPEQRVREILAEVQRKLDNSGKVIQIAVASTIKRHFQSIYPGSTHYSPDKVTLKEAAGSRATVGVDVPGITRAYRDLDIRAKNAKRLAIPMHRQAFGVSPRDVPGLFYAKNKKGTEMLAKTEGGSLVVMYVLKESVHQKRDPGLMPSDKTLADNVFARLKAYLAR